jgi:hypothetical protein
VTNLFFWVEVDVGNSHLRCSKARDDSLKTEDQVLVQEVTVFSSTNPTEIVESNSGGKCGVNHHHGQLLGQIGNGAAKVGNR